MDRGRRKGCSARRQDDALERWWKMVTPLGLLLRLTMGGDDMAERFRGVQPGHHVGGDAYETHVVLWSRLGRHGGFNVYPTTKPDARSCPHEGRVELQWHVEN